MEILLGTNSPVKHKVYWKGSPRDADGLPFVKVYDITEDPAVTPAINPGTLITTLTPTKLETDIGVYEVYPPHSLTNRNKQLKLVWEYSVEGVLLQKEHKLFVVTPYVDITQAADVLRLGSDPSDPNYKSYFEIAEAERYARKVIENYTGQTFSLYNDVHTVYGAGADVLPLPFKLSTLHEMYENDIMILDYVGEADTSVNENQWTYNTVISESGFGIRINRANMLDNTVYVANGMVPPSINYSDGGAFRKDSVYRVAGVYGWEYVPDEVELAAIELMKDYFSKDKVWRDKYMKSISTFDWKFEYQADTYRGTGNVYVDQILLPYVVSQMVVI
jgi:hypothetical protein